MALIVTFTVCDAQQIGLSPSDASLLQKNLAAVRTVRPEQKTPPVLAPLRVSNQAFASRKQVAGAPCHFDGSKCFRYALIPSYCWLLILCPQPNSGESTRGPPRGAPPIFLLVA